MPLFLKLQDTTSLLKTSMLLSLLFLFGASFLSPSLAQKSEATTLDTMTQEAEATLGSIAEGTKKELSSLAEETLGKETADKIAEDTQAMLGSIEEQTGSMIGSISGVVPMTEAEKEAAKEKKEQGEQLAAFEKEKEEKECAPRTSSDPCDYVLNSGKCEFERINYLGFHYCTIIKEWGMPSWVTAVIFMAWLVVLFCMIGNAADGFFAPAVALISDRLQLAPDVAGATLLAFGNGAADFFTQIAAITHSSTVDLPLALGESVGAAVYVCSFCMAVVIFISPVTVVVQSGPFTRDALAYLVALSLTAEAIVDSNFEVHESIILVAWYLMYLGMVFFGAKLLPSFFSTPKDSLEGDSATAPILDSKYKQSDVDLEKKGLVFEAEEVERPENSLAWLKSQVDATEMNLFSKLFMPLNACVNCLEALTMPPMDVKSVGRVHAALFLSLGPVFAYFVFAMDPKEVGNTDVAIISLLACAGLVSTLVLYPGSGLSPASSGLLTAVAFVQGIAWMDICADEIVAVFQTLGRVLGLPEAFLGATLLAWGASSGDLAALMATARAGHGSMAISACFAGPLFQLLMGTGCSLLYVGLNRGNILMEIHSNLPAMFGFALVLMLFLSSAVPLIFRYRFTKNLGYILFGFFTCYVVLMSCTGFGVLVLN